MNGIIAVLLVGLIFYMIFFASYVNKTIYLFNSLKTKFNSRNITSFKDEQHSKLYNKIKRKDSKLFENNIYVHAYYYYYYYYYFLCCLFCIPIIFLIPESSSDKPSFISVVLLLLVLFIEELILKAIIKYRRKRFDNMIYITETYSLSDLKANNVKGETFFL